MSAPKPTKEQVLLFNLLKGDAPQSLEGTDTKILFELFRRHRLFPMAGPLLPLLGDGEKDSWKEAMQRRSIRSMHQLSVLAKITRCLEEKGIHSLSLKGPVLARELFGNLGERHSSDLDILIRSADTQPVIESLADIGFELIHPKKGLSERQWTYYTRYKKDIALFSKEQSLMLEVHYSIENYMDLGSTDLDRFMENSVEIELAGEGFRTMSREQNFLYLTFHGAVHQYRRLFWLRDIAAALSRWELDHGQILEEAQALGIDRMLGVSLELAREICNAKLPEAYADYLEENRKVIGKLKRTSMSVILGPEFPKFRGKMNHHAFMLRSKPELKHYFRTIREILNRKYISRFLGGH